MFDNPYFLLLFVLSAAFLVYRSRRYYLRHAYVRSLTDAKPAAQYRVVQTGCMFAGWCLLILASANFLWGTTVVQKHHPVHKYILINDGSGSMVEIKRDRGVGRRLDLLYKGNKALLDMLDKRNDGSKDLVGAIVFSNDAFVVSYMVDEPQFVAKKLSYVDYRYPPMNQGTQLENALWAGIEMILSNEKEIDDDLNKVNSRMYGVGFDYEKKDVQSILEKYRPIAQHSCVVIFTDGEFDNPAGTKNRMSVYKQLRLCKDLGIKVYVISVETVDNFVERYTKDTGGFSTIFQDFDENKFKKAYENIVESQAQEEIIVEQHIKKSFATIIATIALGFLSVGLFLSLTTGRNFTEV